MNGEVDGWLTMGERSATFRTIWRYAAPDAAPCLVSAYPKALAFLGITTTHEIAEFDLVELREAFETAPAGATGGVLDLLGGDMATVEFTSLPADLGVDRILVVPFAKLRVIEPPRRR